MHGLLRKQAVLPLLTVMGVAGCGGSTATIQPVTDADWTFVASTTEAQWRNEAPLQGWRTAVAVGRVEEAEVSLPGTRSERIHLRGTFEARALLDGREAPPGWDSGPFTGGLEVTRYWSGPPLALGRYALLFQGVGAPGERPAWELVGWRRIGAADSDRVIAEVRAWLFP